MEANRVGGSRIKALLDTNMILAIADGIRVKDDLEVIINAKVDFLCPQSVIDELTEIASLKKEGWKKAEWTLLHLDKICERISSLEKETDLDLLLLADKLRDEGLEVIVATNDRELRKKLRQKNIPTAFVLESEMMIDSEYP